MAPAVTLPATGSTGRPVDLLARPLESFSGADDERKALMGKEESGQKPMKVKRTFLKAGT
jgi:hypothetical protein